MLVFDLDNFKRLNDEMGHDAGDAALMEIARICRQQLRKNDVVARLGGDEFVVVMPGTQRSDALNIAERLRQDVPIILKENIHYESTISGGLSQFDQLDRFSSDVLKRADEGLYRSKRRGRNMVSAV